MVLRTLLALLSLVFVAPVANAIPVAVSFTGSDGVTPISGSFQYESTLPLTPEGADGWSAEFTGTAILNGTLHSASFMVGVESNVSDFDSGATTCDYFVFDIYLDANDALGPESAFDVNNGTLVIVDFELAAGTLTPAALPDFLILNSSIISFALEYATAGNGAVNIDMEWDGADFSTNATGSLTPIPEPGSGCMLALGLLGIAVRRRREVQ